MNERLNHEQSDRFEKNNYFYMEFDKFDRCTFSMDKYGFWAFCFYNQPTLEGYASTTPYQVVHKYTEFYLNTKVIN